jgi:glycosyltransferase involved in cell wall biosynthesis
MGFRILQVVQEFSLEGGVETVAFELQRAWEAAGVHSTVLARIAPDSGRSEIKYLTPWLARIPTRGRWWQYLGRMIVVPLFTLAATAEIRRQKDAVTVSHGDTFAGDIVVVHAVNKASLAAKARNGRQFWRLNPMHYWVSARDALMIGGLRFRRYVAVSRRVAQELIDCHKVPPERIEVIPNGINLDRFRATAQDRQKIRREFDIPDAAPLLLFVGHEFERKGLLFVIEALGLLGPDARLLVVGSDNLAPYKKRAAELGVSDRVIFAGARFDMPAIYSAGDAFVFPTAYESFSLVCMEALACRVPIFATMVGGIEDYLQEGVNGAAITRDGVDIAAKLRPVLEDPARLSRLREGAETTARDFGWPAIATRYERLLREVWREREGVSCPPTENRRGTKGAERTHPGGPRLDAIETGKALGT